MAATIHKVNITGLVFAGFPELRLSYQMMSQVFFCRKRKKSDENKTNSQKLDLICNTARFTNESWVELGIFKKWFKKTFHQTFKTNVLIFWIHWCDLKCMWSINFVNFSYEFIHGSECQTRIQIFRPVISLFNDYNWPLMLFWDQWKAKSKGLMRNSLWSQLILCLLFWSANIENILFQS